MLRKRFGKICASLRKEMFNPAKGRVWTQQEVATVANLPIRLVGQIERGEKVVLDSDVLTALADFFRLTTSERERFFAFATGVSQSDLSRERQTIEAVLAREVAKVKQIQQPVLLHDGLYRIIGLNSAYREIYGLTRDYLNAIPEGDVTKYHIVRHLHDAASPVRQVYHSHRPAVEVNNVVYWRYLSLAHRDDPLFDEIQSQLQEQYATFSTQWGNLANRLSGNDPSTLLRVFYCDHPQLGLLNYIILSTQLYKGERELFMTILCPLDVETNDLFNHLVKDSTFTCFDTVANDLQNVVS